MGLLSLVFLEISSRRSSGRSHWNTLFPFCGGPGCPSSTSAPSSAAGSLWSAAPAGIRTSWSSRSRTLQGPLCTPWSSWTGLTLSRFLRGWSRRWRLGRCETQSRLFWSWYWHCYDLLCPGNTGSDKTLSKFQQIDSSLLLQSASPSTSKNNWSVRPPPSILSCGLWLRRRWTRRALRSIRVWSRTARCTPSPE